MFKREETIAQKVATSKLSAQDGLAWEPLYPDALPERPCPQGPLLTCLTWH